MVLFGINPPPLPREPAPNRSEIRKSSNQTNLNPKQTLSPVKTNITMLPTDKICFFIDSSSKGQMMEGVVNEKQKDTPEKNH